MLDKLSSNKTTDFDDGLAVGFMLGVQKCKKNNNYDWFPPNMPEATEYQIIILYEVTESIINKPVLNICPIPYVFNGSEYIDWGDGSVTVIKPGDTDLARNYSHAYAAAGLYVITINCSELTEYIYLDNVINDTFITGGSFPPAGVEAYFNGMNASNDCIRAIKLGENIYSRTIIDGENNFTGLVYLKYCGNSYNNAAEALGDDGFYHLWHNGCSALCRVDFDVLPEKIPRNMFRNCVALRNAPFASKLAEIPTGAFQNCTALASADISSVKKVGAAGFQNCTSLCDLKYSEDCVFADGATDNCFCLYSKP